MIIQTAADGKPRFAIMMDEHTALAGQFARAFGNASFEPVEPRELMLYMVQHHDQGWAALDAAPMHDPRTGLPFNLADTPAPYITRTSTASPEFNERHHPYCGLLSSMHSWGLYNGRYGLSDMVLIDRIAPGERHYADRMLEGELARQTRLKAALAADPQTAPWVEPSRLFQSYKQLQFFDTLALYFNRTHEGARAEATFKHVPLDRDTDVPLHIRPLSPGVYGLEPYPFAEDPGEFFFTGRYIEPMPEGTQPSSWGSVLADAPSGRQSFRIVAG